MADKINVRDECDKGKVYARFIFQVFGKPKEHVEKSISMLVNKFKSMEELRVVVEKYFEPKKIEGMWSNFVELEMLVKDMASFFDFIVNFIPASVEILHPEKLVLKSSDINGPLNDLSVKLLNISNEYQTKKLESDILKKKLNTLVSINILRSLKNSDKTIKELSDDTRIDEDDLKPFLDDLVKNNRAELKNDKYCLRK